LFARKLPIEQNFLFPTSNRNPEKSKMARLYLSPPHMSQREPELVQEVFASNWVAPAGPMLTAFEKSLSQITGIEHVAAVSSGTAALHLALLLLDVGPGDEVWGSTLTFIGGVAPILYVGATAVFLDVDDRLLIDLDLLEGELRQAARRGKAPKVVITTDLYGFMPDIERVERLADEYGFIWISDSAEAMGSTRNGKHAGKGATFAIYSFNGNKIITTSGGGALASDDPELIRRAQFLATQAREPVVHYEHVTYGYNYRLSNVSAAIGVGQLDALPSRVDARRRVYDSYRRLLKNFGGLEFCEEPAGLRANRWLTTVLLDPEKSGLDPNSARLALEASDIESRPIWKPMHMQPLFANAQMRGGAVSEDAFNRGLCLPSGSAMTEADVERVVDVLCAASEEKQKVH
jgi:pyridoxal phosphate-dependent aminotransferase EpsN